MIPVLAEAGRSIRDAVGRNRGEIVKINCPIEDVEWETLASGLLSIGSMAQMRNYGLGEREPWFRFLLLK